MFFTDFDIMASFREACLGEGTDGSPRSWPKRREGLRQMIGYFERQSEIMKSLRLHLYSHAQFSHSHGIAGRDKERLHEAYESCRTLQERCEKVARSAKDVHSSILGHRHEKFRDLLGQMEDLSSLAERHRHHVAFAISHRKESQDMYSFHEKELMELESLLREQGS